MFEGLDFNDWVEKWSDLTERGQPELERVRSVTDLHICGKFQVEASSGFWHSKW